MSMENANLSKKYMKLNDLLQMWGIQITDAHVRHLIDVLSDDPKIINPNAEILVVLSNPKSKLIHSSK